VNEENTKKQRITVLLAEDHEHMRAAIRRMLEAEPDIHVVVAAETFHETLKLANEFKPRVVVMDLHMPGEQDLEPSAVKAQLLLSCSRILAMSFSQNADSRALAERYGASLLLDKLNLVADLLPAIRGLAR
jgi:two-component system response regulator DegU